MTSISLTVNGEHTEVDVQPRTNLADLLREQLRLTGTHLGCEHGVCGACTVLIDGVPVRACITVAVSCDGQDVRSIEGFEKDALMADLRQAFKREHGLQCGFCTPGMLIAARDIVMRVRDPDENRIRQELSGNLCRCTGYVGIINAVRSVIESRGGVDISVSPSKISAKTVSPAVVRSELAQRSVAKLLAARAQEAPAAKASAAPPRAGWTRLSESFIVEKDVQTVWEALTDFPLVSACLPGAQLTEHNRSSVKGLMNVKLGPMRAAFAGAAEVELDEITHSGRIRGGGSDSGSGSRTKANATYRVEPNPAGQGARVSIDVEYNLQGPLAQFSRSGVAQDLARRMVGEFARNINARLQDPQAKLAGSNVDALEAGGLIRFAIKEWFRRVARKLFGP